MKENEDSLLLEMSKPAFWQDENRFNVMESVEFLDRFETALKTAESLYDRLNATNKKRSTYRSDMLKNLAERIFY